MRLSAVLLPSQYPRFDLDDSLVVTLSAGRLLLLAGRDFLLCRDGALARPLTSAGIGVRALSVYRQVAAMAHPAIALNFDQPPDVHLDLLAEISFDAPLGFNGL